MQEKKWRLIRFCAVVAVLMAFIMGMIQPASANGLERARQKRIVITVEDVNQAYRQDAVKGWSDNQQDYDSYVFFSPLGVDGYEDAYMGFLQMRSGIYFDIDQGSYELVVETGKRGDVSGTFSFNARAPGLLTTRDGLSWGTVSGNSDLTGFEETHQIQVRGEIQSGKAVYNSDGFLRVVSDEEYCSGSCGTVEVVYTYSAIYLEAGAKPKLVNDTASFRLEIDEFTMITNFKGQSGFWMRSEGGKPKSLDPFRVDLENDPDGYLSRYVDLDFGDLGNEKEIPDFPGAGDYEDGSQEQPPQLEEAPDLSDSPDARFSISAGCDDSIAGWQDIDCRVNIQRDSEDVGGLMVVWVMDGFVANQELVLGDSVTFNFPNPPPGSHTVQVQVIDSDTADVRVVSMGVEVGGFASPDDAPNRIPAGAQTGSAVGTTALIGAWLWAEWRNARANALAEERRDAKEAKERQAWYEAQMARNDAVKARQQAMESQQQALEAEWKRYRDGLLETVKKHEKSEYLVDLLDDMQADVYRNGQWDAKGLRRLEGLIDTHLVMDRQHEVSSEWKRMWNFYKRQEAEANSILRGNAMSGVELVAGVLTQGASDLIFMPTKAIVSAVYARRRAMMLGKTGWDAAKSVMKESGTTLLTDYITGKAVGAVVNKALGAGAVVGRKIIGEEGIEALSKWGQRTGTRLGVIPKPAPELPIIRQSWGRGPQVYLDRPIYRPGSRIPIGVGFENGLDRIGRINTGLADDVRRMIGEGVQVDPHLNNVLSPGNVSYTLTPQDEIARDLMNNASYKQAVREGLVPPRVQQVVYQTRDKIAKNATMEAFQALDNVDLNGQAASSYIKSVTVTGTGARPLNPRAVGRYTDWDATVIAKGSGAVGRQAEELFAAKFQDSLRRAGVHADTAEVTMFAGVHAGPNAPAAGGYGSEGLTHWHKVDMTYQGQRAVRLEDGGVMFNAHPDVAPVTGFGPMEAAPRFPAVSEDVAADARRLIHSHITARVAETGGPLDPQTVLRMEGKHAARVWKVNNTGRGADMPGWMKQVMRLKNDPEYHLSGAELENVWKNYTEYMGLPDNLGGTE